MYKIVIAEDKKITREGLKRLIDWNSIGAEVVGAFENGNSTIEYLKDHPVDIVLTDIVMDNGNGIDLSEFIHKEYPNIKIIMITAFENFKYAKKALELGVFAYVLKPINENEVLEKVTEAIVILETEREKTQLISNLTREQIAKDLQEFLEGGNSKLTILKQVFPEANTRYVAISIKSKDHTHISSASCRAVFLTYFESAYTIRSNGFLTCIVLLKEEQQLTDVAMNNIYISLYRNSRICIGEIVSSLEELSYSLRTSYLAYNHSFLHNTRGIIPYKDIEVPSKEIWENGADTYMEYSYLKNLIFQDKVDKYRSYIENIFTTYRYNQVGQKDILNRCKEALKYLCDVTNEYLMYKSLLTIDYTDMYDAVDLSELKSLFLNKVDIIHKQIDEKKKEKIRPIVKLALEYSIKNIKDSSLNLKDISSHLNVSYAYLSRAFKEDFGTNYTEYMNLYRIEMAKKQLLDTEDKVYEICEGIGLEPKNFYYLFKKYEGFTPKEFKAINPNS